MKHKLAERERFMRKTRLSVTEAFQSRDIFLGNLSKAIDEINRVANVLSERLEELYTVYLPELKVEDREKFARLVLVIDKKAMSAKVISDIVGSAKANEIINAASSSMGIDLSAEDLQQCKALAAEINNLYALRTRYEKYEEKLAEEVCPNIAYVAGPAIAAKLIAHVGSLKRLAVLPASTIQVIGAERALFKHLKNKKIKPPKHGIIFQHARISNSPKKLRGKIARVLAAKIAMGAKADYYTHNFIAKELKEDFDRRYEEIMKLSKKE